MSDDNLSAEIVAEQEAVERVALRKLDDFAFALLNATNNDTREAERLLDDSLALLCENNVLQMYRYRYVLARVREGL